MGLEWGGVINQEVNHNAGVGRDVQQFQVERFEHLLERGTALEHMHVVRRLSPPLKTSDAMLGVRKIGPQWQVVT
jgi:hypothetical protein